MRNNESCPANFNRPRRCSSRRGMSVAAAGVLPVAAISTGVRAMEAIVAILELVASIINPLMPIVMNWMIDDDD